MSDRSRSREADSSSSSSGLKSFRERVEEAIHNQERIKDCIKELKHNEERSKKQRRRRSHQRAVSLNKAKRKFDKSKQRYFDLLWRDAQGGDRVKLNTFLLTKYPGMIIKYFDNNVNFTVLPDHGMRAKEDLKIWFTRFEPDMILSTQSTSSLVQIVLEKHQTGSDSESDSSSS